MSCCVSSIDAIYLKVDEVYLEELKKDVQRAISNPDFLLNLQKNQREMLEQIISDYNENNEILANLSSFADYVNTDEVSLVKYTYKEHYAYSSRIDIETGERLSDTTEAFNGYTYCLYAGFNNMYKPCYTDKGDFIRDTLNWYYIPTGFSLKDNVFYITGSYEG